MKVNAVGNPCNDGNPWKSYLIGPDEFPDILDALLLLLLQILELQLQHEKQLMKKTSSFICRGIDV